jgi:serine/threonine protein kinase
MILENYVLEKNLGKGAFGEVYLTKRKDNPNVRFATKKLDREQIEGSEAVKYLKNEIEIMQKLDHPNIVKFETIKKTKKHFYLIMEFCNGGELSKALEKYQEKNGHPFTQEIVQHLMRQIIDAFKYIHGQKVIHRDIKLENILLNFESEEDKEGLNMMKAQVKIIDFGFACFINKSGLLYSTLGSPINMDPIILKKLNSSGKKA